MRVNSVIYFAIYVTNGILICSSITTPSSWSDQDVVECSSNSVFPPNLVSVQKINNERFFINFFVFTCGSKNESSISTLPCFQVTDSGTMRPMFNNCTDTDSDQLCLLRIFYVKAENIPSKMGAAIEIFTDGEVVVLINWECPIINQRLFTPILIEAAQETLAMRESGRVYSDTGLLCGNNRTTSIQAKGQQKNLWSLAYILFAMIACLLVGILISMGKSYLERQQV